MGTLIWFIFACIVFGCVWPGIRDMRPFRLARSFWAKHVEPTRDRGRLPRGWNQ